MTKKKYIKLQLPQGEFKTAEVLKSIYSMTWDELFVKLVNEEILRKGYDKRPLFSE